MQGSLKEESKAPRKTFRKAAFRLLPFLFICYILAYLDRVNVSFANLQMGADLKIDAAAYGFGAGIFFLGYFFFEVPSNLLMRRFGAKFWIFRIMITWGIIASAMAFMTSAKQFYVLRFLLGVAEAGFFPGIILYLSSWFPSGARAKTVALFMAAIPVAGIFGGPFSGWLMGHFHGTAAAEGWRWLFLLEGVPSILCAFFVLYFLPDSPAKAPWLNESEKRLVIRILSDEEKNSPVKAQRVFDAFKVPLVWVFSAIYFCATFGLYCVSFWLPQLIKDSGETSIYRIGLLSAGPWMAALIVMLIVSFSSDKRRERRFHSVFSALLAAAGIASCAFVCGEWQALAAMSMAAAGVMSLIAVHWSMPPLFLSDWAKVSGIAIINSVGNIAGFVGPWIIGKEALGASGLAAGFLLTSGVLVLAAILLFIFAPQERNPYPKL